MNLVNLDSAADSNLNRPDSVDTKAVGNISRKSPRALVSKHAVSSFDRAAKRSIDLALSSSLGLLLLPLLALIAVVIKCVSRGPVFYGQVRVGYDGRPFRMWKFRTMIADAERKLDEYLMDNPEDLREWKTRYKLSNDPRIIPGIGTFLRKSSLDELPQLWNVLIGEMSLVGPRPLPHYHLDQFDDEFLFLRGTMRPGITGQWQVSSRGNGCPKMFQQWDTDYLRNWSIWLDLKILIRTPWVLFSGK